MTIILSIILGAGGYFGHKFIRKHYELLLGSSIVLAVLSMLLDVAVFEIITEGFIGLALFVVVMFAGAFVRGNKVSKRLRSIRKEYSILGFVLLMPHAIKYLIEFVDGGYAVEWIGIVAFLVMVPLFITSFNYFKKKFEMKQWKNLQKWAYLSYALIFVHLIIVADTGHQFTYILIFGVYSFFKLKNYLLPKNNEKPRTIPALLIVIVAGALVYGIINITSLQAQAHTGIDYNNITLTDGTYNASTTGYRNTETEIEVTVSEGVISDISLINCGCTEPERGVDFEQASLEIIEDIISTQSTNIDTISGATTTTDSVLLAVEQALDETNNEQTP